MKEKTAINLLSKVLGWDPNKDGQVEVPILQALAFTGYDQYSQFTQGIRFIGNLANWLRQFKEDERKIAYRYIQDKLLFIPRFQMAHLVEITFSDFLQPILLQQITNDVENIHEWEITKLLKHTEYNKLLLQSLFLGLSDGASIDIFRRSNPQLTNEQVSRSHEISADRIEKIIKDLSKSLKKLNLDKEENKKYFKNIFLLDDFSASGISYIRKEKGELKGKLANFYNLIIKNGSNLINKNDLHVYLILYVSTDDAENYIRKNMENLLNDVKFDIIIIHKLDDSIKFNPDDDPDFLKLIEKTEYGIEDIIDEHFKKGKHDNPYLGYDECALPLILHHNTPNNSLPILWRNDKRTKFKGLFPRISRHV